MSDTKTPLELAREERAHADAATPGPWKHLQSNEKQIWAPGIHSDGSSGCIALACGSGIRTADFIARARAAVPALCDAIESQAAEIERLRGALRGLVTRLDEVHADSRYQAVRIMFGNHDGVYTEPTYTDALARARAALEVKP